MENIEKHLKTGRISGKFRKPCENRENQGKTEKPEKTGRIRGKHRKTWKKKKNQGKTSP